MIQDYISRYLNKARYELIDNGTRFYAEVKELKGVWAVGKTLEGCRANLVTALEGWMILRLRRNLPIPNFKLPSFPLRLKQHA